MTVQTIAEYLMQLTQLLALSVLLPVYVRFLKFLIYFNFN